MAPLEALDIKDQGHAIAFRGIYSGQDIQERYNGLRKLMQDSGYQIRGQLVPSEDELIFNLKVPKTLAKYQEYADRLNRALDTEAQQEESDKTIIEGEYRIVE